MKAQDCSEEERRESLRRWKKRNPGKMLEYARRYRAKHQAASNARTRAGHLRRKYGITPAQYDEMFARQGGVCAVCGRPPMTRRLAVDHDHVTKRVRGLLCFHCNKYLVGKLNVGTAKLVLAYLDSDFDGRTL